MDNHHLLLHNPEIGNLHPIAMLSYLRPKLNIVALITLECLHTVMRMMMVMRRRAVMITMTMTVIMMKVLLCACIMYSICVNDNDQDTVNDAKFVAKRNKNPSVQKKESQQLLI